MWSYLVKINPIVKTKQHRRSFFFTFLYCPGPFKDTHPQTRVQQQIRLLGETWHRCWSIHYIQYKKHLFALVSSFVFVQFQCKHSAIWKKEKRCHHFLLFQSLHDSILIWAVTYSQIQHKYPTINIIILTEQKDTRGSSLRNYSFV